MTLEVPKPTEAEAARAENRVAIALESAAFRSLASRLEEPFRVEEEEVESSQAPPDTRVVMAEKRGHDLAEHLSRTFFDEKAPTPAEAAWALDQIIRAEDEAERVKRRAEAQIERAERRAKWIREMLWPALLRYTESAPRSSKKSWKFDGCEARLTLRDSPARLTVRDKAEALKYVRSRIGAGEAIEREIIRVREEVSESKLREWAEASGEAGKVPGTEYEPAQERLTLYRR